MIWNGEEYTKDCRDFDYTGVTCCPDCHEDPDHELEIVRIDGELALLCCALRRFFYPEGHDTRLSPEERLLRAIFTRPHPKRSD